MTASWLFGVRDPGCVCPRVDARDCIQWRSKDDMREHLGDDPICGPDDECECSCHDDDHGGIDLEEVSRG